MALNKAVLDASIAALIATALAETDPANRAAAIAAYATALANAIDVYVKTGTAGGDPVI